MPFSSAISISARAGSSRSSIADTNTGISSSAFPTRSPRRFISLPVIFPPPKGRNYRNRQDRSYIPPPGIRYSGIASGPHNPLRTPIGLSRAHGGIRAFPNSRSRTLCAVTKFLKLASPPEVNFTTLCRILKVLNNPPRLLLCVV
jgi:hypothetical protein